MAEDEDELRRAAAAALVEHMSPTEDPPLASSEDYISDTERSDPQAVQLAAAEPSSDTDRPQINSSEVQKKDVGNILRDSAKNIAATVSTTASDARIGVSQTARDIGATYVWATSRVEERRQRASQLWAASKVRERAEEATRGVRDSVSPVFSPVVRAAGQATEKMRETAGPAIAPVVDKTLEASKNAAEAGRTVGARMAAGVSGLNLSLKFAAVGTSVRQMDEKHAITKKTAETVDTVSASFDRIASRFNRGRLGEQKGNEAAKGWGFPFKRAQKNDKTDLESSSEKEEEGDEI